MTLCGLSLALLLSATAPAQEAPTEPPSPPAKAAVPEPEPEGDAPDQQGDDDAPPDPEVMAPPVDQRPEGAERSGSDEALSPTSAMRRAAALAESGKTAEAIELMEVAVKRFEDRAELLWTLALLYRDTGDAEKAESLLRTARTADPNNGQVHAELAALLEKRGEYPEALTAANRAVVLLPRDPGVRADRAIIRFQMGQMDGAIQDMRRATRERPRDPDLRLNHALIRMGRGREADVKRAIELLQSLRRELPEDDRVALSEGIALTAAKRDREAKVILEALLKRNPTQGWAAFVRGLIAWRAGDTLKADSLGRIARATAPKEFVPQRYLLRRFFIRDAKGYLKWIDDRIAGRETRQKPRPTSRPLRISGLRVDGACDRREIRARISGLLPRVQSCFDTRSGRVQTQLLVERGLVESAEVIGNGVEAETDACVLALMRALNWDRGDCEVTLTWFRGSDGPRKSETNGATAPPPGDTQLEPPVKTKRKERRATPSTGRARKALKRAKGALPVPATRPPAPR
ncbi:MAG: tetratricopeptide repeat protein [Myxococcota bacterium]|nr:tetratricopeptide repeat protein [Myxococcota bacterium]